LDASYKLTDQHTLRGGFLVTAQHATVGTSTLVFPVDAAGNQTSDIPLRIVDNSGKYGYFYGFYLQDEWKPFEQLTINFGGRFDIVDGSLTRISSVRESISCMSHGKGLLYTPVMRGISLRRRW